jgi:broad specificity phosphatase PhoE
MARLILVRHAQSIVDPTRNPAKWDLDPAGFARLNALALLPAFADVTRVACSLEPKAIKTAAAIVQANGLPSPEQFLGLGEIYKAGVVEDHDQVMDKLFAEAGRPVLPDWESAAAALARFRSCLAPLLASGGNLLVVSHGTVLSLYLAWLLGQDRVNLADWSSIGFPDYAIVDPGAKRLIQPFGTWVLSPSGGLGSELITA